MDQRQKPSKAMMIGAALSVVFMLTGLIVGQHSKSRDDKLLAESGAYATGKVTEIVHYKGKNVTCSFMVNGIPYKARRVANDARDPVYMGDTFFILYYTKNPRINRILFDRRAD